MTAIKNISVLCQYSPGDRDAIREDHGTCEMQGCQCSCHEPGQEPELLAGPLARDPDWLEWIEGQLNNYPGVTLLGICEEQEDPEHLHLDCNVGFYLPAFMGVGTKINTEVAIYDSETIVELLYNEYLNDPVMLATADDAGELYDAAREHFSYNVQGSYTETSPLFIDKPPHLKQQAREEAK